MNNTQDGLTEWLTVKEVAKRYPVSESFVRKMIRERQIRTYRVGRKVLIKPEDFEEVFQVVESFAELSESYL